MSINRVLRAAAASYLVLFALAFVAAPYSCEGGLTAYFWSGVACVLVVFTLPFVLVRATSVERRFLCLFALRRGAPRLGRRRFRSQRAPHVPAFLNAPAIRFS